jgi:2-polyprenyl-3-methyl-5-hydroxy-6-metoxy-1,4-benzoquinol methylase
MKSILSPLTNTPDTKLIRTISTAELCKLYYEALKIDVSQFFIGLDSINIYECVETGFKFYQPFGIDGDGHFYEQLQQFDWYYMPWKWEHEQVFKQINISDKVLEIGCGPAHFIQKLNDLNIECTGLELNQKTVNEATAKNLNVRNEIVQFHAMTSEESYDVVCSFQVMEHIAEIKEVIDASIKCLKKGGRLFISVPNNGSFLGLDDWNILNMPPHHMGLWNKQSLTSLQNIFPLKLKNIYLENMEEHHKPYFRDVISRYMYHFFQQKYGSFLGKLINRVFKKTTLKKLNRAMPELNSFTIIAEYSKI